MKYRSLSVIILFLTILFAVPLFSLATADRSVSEVERRPLAQSMSFQEYLSTHPGAGLADYLSYLETCLLDQFPARDDWRELNAVIRVFGLRQRDYKLYYRQEGHLGRLDPILHDRAVDKALSVFKQADTSYLYGNGKHCFALIPDKNVFMADSGGYPHYSYNSMLKLIEGGIDPRISLLPLLENLSLDDYYRTDPHWKQTELLQVANRLLEALGSLYRVSGRDYRLKSLSPYLGTYAGQAALPVEADTLSWFVNEELSGIRVLDLVTGEVSGIYREDRLEGADLYDLFMGWARPLLRLDNPAQANGRQLLVFRDSFGSSLIPLLTAAYSEILVIDLRYITMEAVSRLAVINPDADVLHLYSTSVLNSPGAFLG